MRRAISDHDRPDSSSNRFRRSGKSSDGWSVLIGNVAQFDAQNGGGGDDGVAVKDDGAGYGVALLAGSCGQSTEGDQGNGEDELYDSAPGDEASLPYRLRIRLSASPQDSRRYWTGRYFKAMSSQVAAAGTRAPRRCTPDCSPGLLLRHTTVGGMAPSTSCSANPEVAPGKPSRLRLLPITF